MGNLCDFADVAGVADGKECLWEIRQADCLSSSRHVTALSYPAVHLSLGKECLWAMGMLWDSLHNGNLALSARFP